MKFKLSRAHKASLKLHAKEIIIAAIVVIAIIAGFMYKKSLRADGSGAGQGALFGGLGGAAIGGAIGGGKGAGIGAGVGLLSGAMIGGASSSSNRSYVSPETKRLNNIYKQIDKKQSKLNKINDRLVGTSGSKRERLMSQAQQYQREINDLQNQANSIVAPQQRAMPAQRGYYGRMN